jgi:hypothetical protein
MLVATSYWRLSKVDHHVDLDACFQRVRMTPSPQVDHPQRLSNHIFIARALGDRFLQESRPERPFLR